MVSYLGFSTHPHACLRRLLLLYIISALFFSSCELRPLMDPEEYEQMQKEKQEGAERMDGEDDGDEESGQEYDEETGGWNQGPDYDDVQL
ncbi:MAG: hypothetical protein IJ686_01790 [Bacteroidales bacterium]|nr:hypothetical protein [Bacteroidales bacterium]